MPYVLEVLLFPGFQYQTDAESFLENLRERLRKFGLEHRLEWRTHLQGQVHHESHGRITLRPFSGSHGIVALRDLLHNEQ
jgi:hypothetical protein